MMILWHKVMQRIETFCISDWLLNFSCISHLKMADLFIKYITIHWHCLALHQIVDWSHSPSQASVGKFMAQTIHVCRQCDVIMLIQGKWIVYEIPTIHGKILQDKILEGKILVNLANSGQFVKFNLTKICLWSILNVEQRWFTSLSPKVW